MTLKDILKLMNKDQVVEVYVLDDNGDFMKTPIYMNRRAHLLDALVVLFGVNYVCNTNVDGDVKVSTGSIGYDSSHIILHINSTIMKKDNYERIDRNWWTYLAPIDNEDVKTIFHHCINEYMTTLIRQSSNELAVKALHSGKLDEITEKILDEMDVTTILMLGITKHDMKNLYSNPSGSGLYKTIMLNIEDVVKGDSGKNLLTILFG